MKEIQMRIIELEAELNDRLKKPKRFHSWDHSEKILQLEGEIKGLEWALRFGFSITDPNIIEQ